MSNPAAAIGIASGTEVSVGGIRTGLASLDHAELLICVGAVDMAAPGPAHQRHANDVARAGELVQAPFQRL